MITGHLSPTKGSIRFEGRDITGMPSRAITRLGISRSFQVAQVFPTMTVAENMRIACRDRARAATACSTACSRRSTSPETRAEADAAIELFQIAPYRDARAATLPQGVRKLLDIAMAVAGQPRLLLLDEPTSGISIEEKFGLMDVVMSALKTRTITVLFVEHDMEIVGALRRPRAGVLRRHRDRRRARRRRCSPIPRVQTLHQRHHGRRVRPCLGSRTSTSRSGRSRSSATPRSTSTRARCAA